MTRQVVTPFTKKGKRLGEGKNEFDLGHVLLRNLWRYPNTTGKDSHGAQERLVARNTGMLVAVEAQSIGKRN